MCTLCLSINGVSQRLKKSNGFFRYPNLLVASTTYRAEGVDRAEEVCVVLLEGHGHQVTGLVLAQVLRGERHHTTPHQLSRFCVGCQSSLCDATLGVQDQSIDQKCTVV